MKRMDRKWWLAAVMGLALTACNTGTGTVGSTSTGGPLERPTGTTDFATRTGGNSNSGNTANGGPTSGREDGDFAGAPSDNGGGGSAPRAIEESDIYKLVGDNLFVLNRYRGLQILDISNLDAPRLVGRAPIYGWPKDMYVRDNKAYVIVSDYYSFWRDEDAASDEYYEPFYGSQLRIIDISNITSPTVVGGINLQGDCGDSRIVGDVMYLVSQRYSWYYSWGSTDNEDKATVLSVAIGDTSNVHVVDTEDFPRQGWEQHINVTPNTIYLASSGWGYDDNTNWTGRYYSQIKYIDISDPAGEIHVRGTIEIPGRVMDRWSMDEFEGALRVASGQSWGNGDIYLTTIAIDDPDHLTQLGQASLQIAEQLTSARFDGPHGYLVTYRNIDPLFTFDLSDPRAPRQLAELEMTGWLDFMVPNGDRVVALGHEDTVDENGNRQFGLAVSLIDVSNQTQPRLIDREVVGSGWGWIPSERDDFAKVFRVLNDQGLILLPFHSWDWHSYSYLGGVQLLDVSHDSLALRGLIGNAGWVERGIPHGDNTVLTLSSEVFQIMDVTNRDEPRLRGRLELARNVTDFAVLNEQSSVQLSGDWYRGDTSLTVVPLNDPDAATPTSSLHVPAPYGRMFKNGNMVYVSSIDQQFDENGSIIGNGTKVQVVDLSDEAHPTVRGSVSIPQQVWSSYGYWYWGWGDQVVQVNDTTLAFFRFAYNYWWYEDGYGYGNQEQPRNTLYLVDLSNPDNPVLASTTVLDDVEWAWGLQARGHNLFMSEYSSFQSDDGYWYARYHLRRIDVTNPAAPVAHPRVNIPGMFIGAQSDDRTIYTVENWWDDSDPNQTRYRTYLHALVLAGDLAYLQSTVELPGYLYSLDLDGNGAFSVTQQWGYRTDDAGNQVWYNDSKLIAVDLSDTQDIRLGGEADVPTGWGYLMGVKGGRAFVSSGPGIFTYSVSDLDHPTLSNFFRTQGWSSQVVVHGEKAFVPSGYYGVQTLQLTNAQ